MRFLLLLLLFAPSQVYSQCPAGSSVVFSNNNFNQPATCTGPQDSFSCPNVRPGSFCQYATQYNQYICCISTTSQCPTGTTPQYTSNGIVMTCQTNNNCNQGYSCYSGVCCSAQGGNSQCPPGSSVVFSNNNFNQPTTCSPQDSCSCSKVRPGSFCQYSSQYNQFICCVSSATQCPSGTAPQLSSSGNVMTCQTNNNCAAGFNCNFGTCCATQNAQCQANQCPDGQAWVNGACIITVPPGQFCQITQQCSGGAVCQSSVCVCPEGGIGTNGQCGGGTGGCQLGQVLVNNQCLPQSPPNGQCTSTLQCLDNSICNGNTCICQNGAQSLNGYCIPFNGGPCSSNQVWINGQCVTYSIEGGACVADQQCVGSSKCQGGFCRCPQGTQKYCVSPFGYSQCYCLSSGVVVNPCSLGQVQVNGVCQPVVPPGGQCASSLQCLANSACNGNMCACQNGAQSYSGYCLTQSGNCQITQTLINGQCVTYSIVGGSCIGDQQCLGGATCQGGLCQCPQGKQRFCVNNASQMCYCLSSSGTTNPNCPSNQVWVNNQCLPQVPLGSYGCQNTLQCLGNSQCVNGFCQCSAGQTQSNGQCVGGNTTGNFFAPGSSCNSGGQCLDSSICNGNTCMCQGGKQAAYGYCLPVKNDQCSQTELLIGGYCQPYSVIGGRCSGNQQCLAGSICQGSVCQCPQGVQQYCLPNTGTNQCYCQSTNTGGQCSPGQVFVNNQCLPQINAGGFGCTYNQQCLGNSQCLGGTCQCPTGTVLQNGQCVGGTTGNCQPYQVNVGGVCLDTVSIGQSCTNQAQCIANSICSGQCNCNSGLTYNGTACISGGISCQAGSVAYQNRCLALVQLGQYCQATPQCVGFGVCSTSSFCTCPSGSNAVNGVCRNGNVISPCNSNQVLIGNQCYNKAPIGSSCIYNQQCQSDNNPSAICQSSICTCPPNTANYGDGICRSSSG